LLLGAWWEQRQRYVNEPVYVEEAHVAAAVSQDIDGGVVDDRAVELAMVGSLEEGNVEALRVAEATFCEPRRSKTIMQVVALPGTQEAGVRSW
jgi:hypothetical protein